MQSTSKPKRYPLGRSPLYRLRGKGKFETVLGVQWDAMYKLLDVKYYRVWTNDKGRQIQAPHGWLAQVHKRIGVLLSRIQLPDYVYSQKGRSYADNARAHRGETPLIKTDISRFYPSVTRQAVFRMFMDDFECAVDVAHRLADICCYKQAHLPTGSPLSGRVAFFAKRHMFDEIADSAQSVGCKMTAYVDDVTVSGTKATKELLGAIRQTIGRHGLRTQGRKSKTYASGAAKIVTGVVVVRDEVRLPNSRHLNIHRARQAVQTAAPAELEHAQRVLAGRLLEASQVLKPASLADQAPPA
ncbi:reverse transcriptase family protein [Pollutimonas sp. M17]|uniref:reverse transcriptase family protein n=1 Tax=Pollutimonas sp. M17 TaxID=2962065 RepID=UPI0021F44841|nr:reverse transcriptase family protein [Pollutimonas sp. M17]UYO94335.1 reverse transcriptase family protein [Pollutimonas sp. M17]